MGMSRKSLNFDEYEINKNKFHGSKQPIGINAMDINRKVTSSKIEQVEKSFKHFLHTTVLGNVH